MGHVGLKTRSPGQILGISCLHSRGQICNPILIELGQNVCFDNIYAKFEYRSRRVKKRSPGHILGNSCLQSRGQICDPILMKHDQFVLTISRLSSNIGHVGSKNRSPGQILGNSCLHSTGYICDPILIELGQNVCFDNINAKFEYGSRRVKK